MEKLEHLYILNPQYLKAKNHLVSLLKHASEYQRQIEYAEERGAKDSGIISGLYKLAIYNSKQEIEEMERWNKVLNGSPFLKENGYRDDFLDDLF